MLISYPDLGLGDEVFWYQGHLNIHFIPLWLTT